MRPDKELLDARIHRALKASDGLTVCTLSERLCASRSAIRSALRRMIGRNVVVKIEVKGDASEFALNAEVGGAA